MKMLRKVLELLDKAMEAVKLPPYLIDPFPWIWWIIVWLILPLLLYSVM